MAAHTCWHLTSLKISIGDFGTGSEVQRSVASQLARSVVDHKVSFIVGLGDNIYDDGITDLDDPQLETKHNQVPRPPRLPAAAQSSDVAAHVSLDLIEHDCRQRMTDPVIATIIHH